MKNLYLITVLLTIFVVGSTFGQPLARSENSTLPEVHGVRRNNVVPFIGFSVAVPLFKQYKRNRQLDKISKLLEQTMLVSADTPSSANARLAEGGPIAWEYTGEGVTVYVPGSGGGGGYYGGWGIGGDDGGSSGGHDEDHAPPGDEGGGNSGDNGGPPRVIKQARKVSKNYCENGKTVFKNMWDRQASRNVEQAAYVTSEGIYWLDDIGNTTVRGSVGDPRDFGLENGKRFFIKDNGVKVYIEAIIHTHPVGGLNGISDDDTQVSSDWNVPIYAITNGGIWKGLPSGNITQKSGNYLDAFDCALVYGLFSL